MSNSPLKKWGGGERMKGPDQYPQELFRVQQTWMHFIGGLYSDTAKFVHEAGKHGISRRAAAQAVKGVQFGDRIIFLRYVKNASFRFAEGVITGITLDHDIAKALGEQLMERGLAEYQEPAGGAGQEITRECGSYCLMRTFVVKVSLSDCLDIALEQAAAQGKEPLFVMINARLTNVYPDPIILQPAPKFTRGFTRATAQQEIIMPQDLESVESRVFSIRNYQKKQKHPQLPASTGA